MSQGHRDALGDAAPLDNEIHPAFAEVADSASRLGMRAAWDALGITLYTGYGVIETDTLNAYIYDRTTDAWTPANTGAAVTGSGTIKMLASFVDSAEVGDSGWYLSTDSGIEGLHAPVTYGNLWLDNIYGSKIYDKTGTTLVLDIQAGPNDVFLNSYHNTYIDSGNDTFVGATYGRTWVVAGSGFQAFFTGTKEGFLDYDFGTFFKVAWTGSGAGAGDWQGIGWGGC